MKWLLSLGALVVGLAVGYWLPASGGEPEGPSSAERGRAGGAADGGGPGGPGAAETEALTEAEERAAARSGISKEWLESLEKEGQLDQLAALIPKMKEASPGDFAMLMDALDKYGGGMKWMARNLLATRWAETDPQGMLRYIDRQPQNEQWGLRSSFYSAWGRKDADAAFASARGMEDRRARSGAMQAVVRAVAEERPRRAVEMAQALSEEGVGGNQSWLFQNIFQTWANSEPEAARKAALALPDGQDKVHALSGAMQEWMADDPMAALNWLDSLPTDGTVYHSRKQVFNNLLNRDFDTAKAFIEQRTDPLERREILSNMYFGNFAWRMDFEEIRGVFDWLGSVSTGQTYDQKVSNLVQTMVDVDPERARDFVLDLPPGNARMNALGQFASKLAERDPAMAIAFAEGLEYEDEKNRALMNMGWQLSRHGIESAAELIASSTDPKVQERLAQRMTGEWSKYDREGALAWAESLENERARTDALRPVFDNWLQADPQGALDYLQNSLEENEQRNFLRNAFGQWTREDPATAVAWLDRLPESLEDQRPDLFGQVTNYYVQHDPLAASEWIASLDEGPERDRSVETLVNDISRTDPEAGFIWAATVGDDNRRRNTLNNSVREWVKTDPDAAYDAVKDARIEAKEKEPLFEMIEKARGKG